MPVNRNFTKFRIFSLGTSTILLLWYFLDIDFSQFGVLKQIPNVGETAISLILSGLLLFFISEIIFEYSKVKFEDRSKQDTTQFIIALIISLITLLIIYPKLVNSTFLSETNRYDILCPLVLGASLGFIATIIRYHIELTFIFVKLRKTILPGQIISFLVSIAILSVIFFLHHYFIAKKTGTTLIFDNILLLLFFVSSFYLFTPRQKLVPPKKFNDLSRLSDSLDRSVEMTESGYALPSSILGMKRQHKKIMKHIGKLKKEDSGNLRVKFETREEIGLSFLGSNLRISDFDEDQIIITSIFYDQKTQKEYEKKDISYKYIRLALDELNKAKSYEKIKDVREILNALAFKALEIMKKETSDPNINMFYIVEEGTLGQLKKLFSKQRININCQIENGYTALNLSVANGEYKKAQYLLQKAADPNIPNKLGVTPLGFAAMYGKKDLCKLLLNYGADLNYQTPECRTTPLIKASQHGHGDVVKLLIDNKAEIELVDRDNKNAVDYAIQMNYGEIAKMLKKS